MIKVQNISVMNFDNAIRGMRNPFNSWTESDSYWGIGNEFIIGEKDLALALKLIKAGTDHSKFMRQIFVSMDITAPIYWWKEMSTYKVGTVANSCSTMHKIHTKKLTEDDFSWDIKNIHTDSTLNHLNSLIEDLQKLPKQSDEYKILWRMLIQELPSSFNQMRTWTANYQVLRNIQPNRKNHKLSEWHIFCKTAEELPYSILITC